MMDVQLFIPKEVHVTPVIVEGYQGACLCFRVQDGTSRIQVTITESQISVLKEKLQEIIDQI